MSLRFCDSFSHYSTNDLYGAGNGAKWTSINGGPNSIPSNVAYLAIAQGGGRFGGNSLRISASNNQYSISKTIDAQATWIMGFALKIASPLNAIATFSTFMDLCALNDAGVNQVEVRLNP